MDKMICLADDCLNNTNGYCKYNKEEFHILEDGKCPYYRKMTERCPRCNTMLRWYGLDDYSEGEYICPNCDYKLEKK